MRLPVVGLLSLVIPAALSGCDCGGDNYASDCLRTLSERAGEDTATVRFRNQMVDPAAGAAQDTALDLLVSTDSEPLAEDVAYTGSGSVNRSDVDLDDDSEAVSFDVRASATDLSIISNRRATLQVETDYTLVVMGTFGVPSSYELAVLEEQDQDPPDNRVSIRFVNTLSETVSPLDIVVDGDVEVAALAYGNASSYTVLDPDNGEIELALRDAQDDAVATVSCDVSDGRTYLGVLGYTGNSAVDNGDIRLYCRSH